MKHFFNHYGAFLSFFFLTQVSTAATYLLYQRSWSIESISSFSCMVIFFGLTIFTFLNLKFDSYEI